MKSPFSQASSHLQRGNHTAPVGPTNRSSVSASRVFYVSSGLCLQGHASSPFAPTSNPSSTSATDTTTSAVKSPFVQSYKPVVLSSSGNASSTPSKQPIVPTAEAPVTSVKSFTRSTKIVPFVNTVTSKVTPLQPSVVEPVSVSAKPREATKNVLSVVR